MMLLVRWNPLIHFCLPLVAHGQQSGLLAQKRLAREEMLEERGGGGGPAAPRTERKIFTVMSTLRALRNKLRRCAMCIHSSDVGAHSAVCSQAPVSQKNFALGEMTTR